MTASSVNTVGRCSGSCLRCFSVTECPLASGSSAEKVLRGLFLHVFQTLDKSGPCFLEELCDDMFAFQLSG